MDILRILSFDQNRKKFRVIELAKQVRCGEPWVAAFAIDIQSIAVRERSWPK